MKILLIEDSGMLVKRITARLKEKYTVDVAYDGHKGLEALSKGRFDLVILDLHLPDMHGSKVCASIRKHLDDVPILVLTSETSSVSKVELLDIGADDYLTKPFDEAELQSRVAALLRRRARNPLSKTIVIDDLIIDISKRRVTREGVSINLRRKEYNILECLAINKGEILERDTIIHYAWNSNSDLWAGSVDVHVKHLRDKLDKPFSYPMIHTEYGIGYYIAGRGKK